MRNKLSEENMDLIMYVVRQKKLKLDDAMNYLLNNPDVIVITRGVLNEQESNRKTCKNLQK